MTLWYISVSLNCLPILLCSVYILLVWLNLLSMLHFVCCSDLNDSGLSDEADCLQCDGCSQQQDACYCAETLATFHHLNSQLYARSYLGIFCF